MENGRRASEEPRRETETAIGVSTEWDAARI
jgi:hypothetical protein